MLRSHKELSYNENDYQSHFLNKINNLTCFYVEIRIHSLSTAVHICSRKEPEMDTKKVIIALNKAIAFEHTAALQYKQHSLLVNGLWRKVFADFFSSQAKSSLEHAAKFGQKIIALGGVPTVEIGGTVRQSTEVAEMLSQDLALEKETMQAYLDAHALTEGDIALRTMLESHIESEQKDIEELERYLVNTSQGTVHAVPLPRAS
jgi:bacterioferritin